VWDVAVVEAKEKMPNAVMEKVRRFEVGADDLPKD
jgi:hypothetical protein